MNNYYEEIVAKIEALIAENDYLKAKMIVDDELKMPYVPKDLEDKLQEYDLLLKDKLRHNEFILDDDTLRSYLFDGEYKQFIAANYLDSLNLRNYLDLIEEYLISDGYKRAKVLIINSLIEQAIDQKLTVNKDGLEIEFIPKYVEPPIYQDGYLKAVKIIEEELFKDPALYKLAMELLSDRAFMSLPLGLSEDEGELLAMSIIVYLYEMFSLDERKAAYLKRQGITKEKLLDLEEE